VNYVVLNTLRGKGVSECTEMSSFDARKERLTLGTPSDG
jgi:hypothetical protein